MQGLLVTQPYMYLTFERSIYSMRTVYNNLVSLLYVPKQKNDLMAPIV